MRKGHDILRGNFFCFRRDVDGRRASFTFGLNNDEISPRMTYFNPNVCFDLEKARKIYKYNCWIKPEGVTTTVILTLEDEP